MKLKGNTGLLVSKTDRCEREWLINTYGLLFVHRRRQRGENRDSIHHFQTIFLTIHFPSGRDTCKMN